MSENQKPPPRAASRPEDERTPEPSHEVDETDALLDSLMADPDPAEAVHRRPSTGPDGGPKLHEPAERLYPPDEVTISARVPDELGPRFANSERPTSPAGPWEGDLIDRLLAESEPSAPRDPEVHTAPTPLVPRPLAAPRPAVVPPRPGGGAKPVGSYSHVLSGTEPESEPPPDAWDDPELEAGPPNRGDRAPRTTSDDETMSTEGEPRRGAEPLAPLQPKEAPSVPFSALETPIRPTPHYEDEEEATSFYSRESLNEALSLSRLQPDEEEATSFYDRATLERALREAEGSIPPPAAAPSGQRPAAAEPPAAHETAVATPRVETPPAPDPIRRLTEEEAEATRVWSREALEQAARAVEQERARSSEAPPEVLHGDEYVEYDADMESLRPSARPSATSVRPSTTSMRPPGSARPGPGSDRPSAERLTDPRVLERWKERAEWMEAEARAAADPQAKARALVVASELWAMTGQLRRARDVASVATAIAPSMPLATRQLRWLAAADGGDWKTVSAALESELRTSPGAAARLHAALLSAEIHRLVFRDDSAAQKKLDLAQRAAPQDPRAPLTRLARLLAESASAPPFQWPQGEAYAELARATEHLAQRRGAPASEDESLAPELAFVLARRAFTEGRRAEAGEYLARLRDVPELRRAVSWLSAALLGVSASTRPRAIELLTSLLESNPSAPLRRTLAARGLEQNDPEAVRRALTTEPSAEADHEPARAAPNSAFSPADRAALAALSGAPQALLHEALAALRDHDPTGRSTADAIARAFDPTVPASETPGAALGTALAHAADHDVLNAALERYRQADPESSLGATLELELAATRRDPGRAARALAELSRRDAAVDTSEARHLAAALAFELAGERERAVPEYQAAAEANPRSEAAARALCVDVEPPQDAAALEQLASVGEDPSHVSLLLLEAALRRGPEAPEFASLIERAGELAPELPFAGRLRELRARSRGDAAELLEVLRARRDHVSDPLEKALDQIREALLMADEDSEGAAALLDKAAEVRPTDIALRELHERVAGPQQNRGAWREAIAAEFIDAKARGALLLQAALEYERAGDLTGARRAAEAAQAASADPLASVMLERLATAGPALSQLGEQLFAQAREETDATRQREAYERLSRLDELRGEGASALLWQNAILERSPGHLPALRRLEHAYVGAGRDQDLAPVAVALTSALSGPEALGHALLGARLLGRGGESEGATELVLRAARDESRPLWALREAAARAAGAADDRGLLDWSALLSERAARKVDAATLALRAGEAALRLGELDTAKALLDRAFEATPEHPVVLARRIELFARLGDAESEAEMLEAVALTSPLPSHALEAWYRAAVCWQERTERADRALAALERASEIELSYQDVFARLQAAYVRAGERTKLAELIELRLASTDDPAERVALEVTRARALLDMGDHAGARAALTAALEQDPNHVTALTALSELCLQDGDYVAAEQALARLSQLSQDPEEQADLFWRLGELYEHQLGSPERAEQAYREVQQRRPGDPRPAGRLVFVYGRLGDTKRALELQNELLSRASAPEEKRDRTLGLARVHEELLGDRRQAEAVLEKARKTWPQDADVLRALIEFHQRGGEDRAIVALLDRSQGEARRALATGRFEASFFRTLATVAEFRGDADATRVARATLGALTAEPRALPGAGPSAGEPRFDELLAPDLLSLPLRALLRRSGSLLDQAFPADRRALRAEPLAPDNRLYAIARDYAHGFNLDGLECLVSSVLGPVCLPASSTPPTLVVGQALLECPDDAALHFLVLRALKILQGNASALARAAAIDLWPMAAAYLSLFAPSWQPQGVDPKKFSDAQSRLRAALKGPPDADAPVLALEVIGSIGNRASHLGAAVFQWGTRTALLALGDPAIAFRALALSSGHGKPLPRDPAELIKWVVRHPEARELAIFSVSEAYLESRRQAGIAAVDHE